MWFLLAACSGSPAEPEAPAAPRPPDIVLVVVDTLRADHLGVYGHDRPTSPAIDAFAADGLVFTRAYAHSGWTLASFASLFTGLLPHQHRVGRDPRDASRFGHLDPSIPTLASALGQQGYHSLAVMNNTFLAPEFGLQSGFDTYDWKGATNAAHRTADETVEIGLGWLGQQTGPALLVLHFMEPHMDYAPAPGDRGRFAPVEGAPLPVPVTLGGETARWASGEVTPDAAVQDFVSRVYDEEILAVDRAFGAMLARLGARDGLTHTVVALTADHGEELWDHGRFEHGHSLHGELTRVPLILGGAVPARGEVRTVVSHADLFQGLVELAGAPRPADTQGASLFGVASVGPYAGPRAAVSENCLYGPPCLAAVDDDARLTVNLASGLGQVWRVDERGGERERLQDAAQSEAGTRLKAVLERVRGGFDPGTVAGDTRVPSPDVFQQLMSLGYVDGPPDAAAPSDPPEGAPQP